MKSNRGRGTLLAVFLGSAVSLLILLLWWTGRDAGVSGSGQPTQWMLSPERQREVSEYGQRAPAAVSSGPSISPRPIDAANVIPPEWVRPGENVDELRIAADSALDVVEDLKSGNDELLDLAIAIY